MEFKKEAIDKSYDLREELGRGQFAVVNLCMKKSTGEKYAAKCIQKRTNSVLSASRGVDLRRIRQEVEILLGLEHDNVVKLFDVFESKSTVTMILEYVEGGELFALVSERERLDEDEASGFVRQLLTGTSYLHANNIAHLDLKPENIMLERTGAPDQHIVKIIDFGLAQRVVNGTPISIEPHGTAEFIPPEVLACELVSTSADLWMVGVIVYVLLSGVSPFAADNDGVKFAHILAAKYSFGEESFANVSDMAKDLIYKLIQRKPDDRLTAQQALEHPWIRPLNSEQLLIRKRSKVKRENLLRLKRYVTPRARWKQTLGVIKVVNRLARSRRNRSQSVVDEISAAASTSNAENCNGTEQPSRSMSVGSSAQFAVMPSTKEASVTVARLVEAVANSTVKQPDSTKSTSAAHSEATTASVPTSNPKAVPTSVPTPASASASAPAPASATATATAPTPASAPALASGSATAPTPASVPVPVLAPAQVAVTASKTVNQGGSTAQPGCSKGTSNLNGNNHKHAAVANNVSNANASTSANTNTNSKPSSSRNLAPLPVSNNVANGSTAGLPNKAASAMASPNAKTPTGFKPEQKRGSSSFNTALLNIRSLLKPVSKQHK